MKNIASMFKKFAKDESGQGATEYILLLVVVVGLALMFKDSIMGTVREKLTALGSSIGSFTTEGNQ